MNRNELGQGSSQYSRSRSRRCRYSKTKLRWRCGICFHLRNEGHTCEIAVAFSVELYHRCGKCPVAQRQTWQRHRYQASPGEALSAAGKLSRRSMENMNHG